MNDNTITTLIHDLRNAKRLFGPDWNARIAAVHELEKARAVSAIPELAAVAMEMKKPELSQAAVKAIGQIGTQAGYKALQQILSTVPLGPLRQESLRALGSSGDDYAVSLLISAWASAGTELASDIQKTLMHVEAGQLRQTLLGALGDLDLAVRKKAVHALHQLPDGLEILGRGLKNTNPTVRQAAKHALIQTGAPAVAPLMDILQQEEETACLEAAEALQKIGAPAIPCLLKVLTDGDDKTSQSAAQVLTQIGATAVEPLLDLACTFSPAVQLLVQMKPTVLSVLQNLGADRLRLQETAFGLPDPELRAVAGEKLAHIGQPAVGFLMGMLCNRSAEQKVAASDALVTMGEPAIPALLETLTGDDGDKAQVSSTILVRMGVKAVPALVQLLNDPIARQKVSQILLEVGATALPGLFQGLTTPDCIAQNDIVDLMCTIAGLDRLALALNEYRQRFPFFLPFKYYEVTGKALMGETFYQEVMSWEDGCEEIRSGMESGYKYVSEDGLIIAGLEVHNASQAIPQLQAIASISQEFALPNYWLGQWYMLQLHDIERAISAFEQASKGKEFLYEHRLAKCYWWLGVAYGTASPHFDYEKSLVYFQRTLDLGWETSLVYQAIHITAQVAVDICFESGKNPALFLAALRKKAEAMSAWMKLDPENEQLGKFCQGNQNAVEHAEARYQQMGEVAAFTQLRSGFLVHKALDMAQSNQIQEAIPLLRRVLSEQPDHEEANVTLGKLMIKSGQMRAGLKQLNTGLQDEAEDKIRLYNRLVVSAHEDIDHALQNLLLQRNFREAMVFMQDWEQMVAATPTWPTDVNARFYASMQRALGFRYHNIAEAGDLLEAHEKALVCYETSFEVYPDPKFAISAAKANAWLGEYYALRELWSIAIPCFKRAIMIDEDNGTYWYNLAYAISQTGDMRTSLKYMVKAAELGNERAISIIAS